MPTTLAALPAARRRFRMSFVLVMLFHSQYNRSGHNQKPAGAADQSETLAEKERGKQDDEGDTQLVDGGNARGFAKLERAKVAEPRQAGGQAGQDEKEPGARCQAPYRGRLQSGIGHAATEDLNHGSPDRGCQIRIDTCDSDFGENRSEEHTSELQSPCNLVCRLLLEKKKKK